MVRKPSHIGVEYAVESASLQLCIVPSYERSHIGGANGCDSMKPSLRIAFHALGDYGFELGMRGRVAQKTHPFAFRVRQQRETYSVCAQISRPDENTMKVL
jgi:hypothetical protein